MADDFRTQKEPLLARESLFRKKLDALRRTGSMPAMQPPMDSQPRMREIERSTYLENVQSTIQQSDPRELERVALLDGLTELYNHSTITRILRDEVKRAKRYKMNMSLLMLSVDGFSEINGRFGALASDSVLKGVANFMMGMIRDVDIPARYDAETFLVICPNTDQTGIGVLSERIRSRLPANRVSDVGQNWNVTVSVGMGSYPIAGTKDEDLIQTVQAALMQAQNMGGNRCMMANK
ncbi:MAG TPA: diguanylate cyclase [Planktothrix sp.]|jgi:diguanylate cyclase (GGDEF)-like protein